MRYSHLGQTFKFTMSSFYIQNWFTFSVSNVRLHTSQKNNIVDFKSSPQIRKLRLKEIKVFISGHTGISDKAKIQIVVI